MVVRKWSHPSWRVSWQSDLLWGIEAFYFLLLTFATNGFSERRRNVLCCLSVYSKRINRDKKNRKVRCPVPDPQSLLSSVHTFPRAERRFLHSQHWGVWLLRQSTSPTLGLCESSACGISRSIQRLGARHLKKVKFIVKMSMLLKKPDSHRSAQLWLKIWVATKFVSTV